MNSTLKWKIAILAFVTVFSAISIYPSLDPNVPGWWKKYFAPKGLQLGLDLQGGMHLVLKVNLPKAVENSLDLASQDLKDVLAEKNISVVRTKSSEKNTVIFTLPNASHLDTVKTLVKDEFPNLQIDIKAEEGSFPRIVMGLSDERVGFIKKNAISQSLEIIRNRIDQFGVAEPVIIRQGVDEIVVQLPGINDPQRALNLIGQTAQLEFKMVVENNGGLDLNAVIAEATQAGQWQWGGKRKDLNLAVKAKLPADTEIYFETVTDPKTNVKSEVPILIRSQVMMSGDMVQDAQARIGGTFNEPYVSLDLTGRGGKIFGQITEKNVNKRFAIILDDVVKSAPVIREKILGGSAQISGNFTYEEASDLAIVLRIGALPAPVDIIQNLTVGASLGRDSIMKGVTSGLLGTVLVILFMLAYYRLSGAIACAGMVLNILLLFVGLAFMNATLTMPGIAGIVLSVGMAVDSNVIIFERMRDEFNLGKTVKSGVDGGYDKAFWTIVDAHVTTLITSLALFLFGTGPVKGFAVTLSFGIIFNLFSTLFGTRLCYDAKHAKKSLRDLKFIEFIRNPKLDYMSIRKYTYTFSLVITGIGLAAFTQFSLGKGNLGIDFAGGSMLVFRANQPFELQPVRTTLEQKQIEGMELQQVTSDNQLIVRIKKAGDVVSDYDKQVSQALTESFPDKGFVLESHSEIGSSVSETLRNKAYQAILISMLGVIVYLALRFDFRFGLAAAIATFHDVIAVLGICWIFDIEITLLIITALLTIAGYSLNDTVVIFDRIRENMHKPGAARQSIFALINKSTNEVLSRSIVVSLTVLLVVLALYFFGGAVIHDFSFALLAGVIFGTYSSIFIASPLLHLLDRKGEMGSQVTAQEAGAS